MPKNTKHALWVIALLLFVVSTAGCDVISSVIANFKKDKKESSPATQAVSAKKDASSVETKAPENVNNAENQAPMAAGTLARVGSWSITPQEFEEKLKAFKEAVPDYDVKDKEARRSVLDQLIRQQLMVEEAKTQRIDKDPEVQKAFDEVRRGIIAQELANRLTKDIQVSSEEMQGIYEKNKEFFVEPKEFHVRWIILDSQERANKLLIDLLKGSDFAEAAKNNSIADNAAAGGDLGYISEAPFQEMGGVLMSLGKGDISSVFKGPKGFYILKVEDQRGGKQLKFEDVKDYIFNEQMKSKQEEKIMKFLDDLRQKNKVEINEKLL